MKQNKTATAAATFAAFTDTRSIFHQINPALVESVCLTGGVFEDGAVVAICLASGREIQVAGLGDREDAVENCLAQLNA